MSSVLLLRPDKAGDLIKTLPVVRALHQTVEDITIHLLVSKANESLLKYEPNLTYSVLPGNWENLEDNELESLLTKLMEGKNFHTAINLLSDSFPQVERLLQLSPAGEKFSVFSESLPIGIWPLTYKTRTPVHQNETVNIAELVGQALGLELTELSLKSPRAPLLGAEDSEEAHRVLGQKTGDWIGLCPFAGTQQRTHPLIGWQKLIGKICRQKKYEKVLVFGAPGNLPELETLKKSLGSPTSFDICSPSSFRTLGAYLKRCDRVVAVDSGPLHFSLALGIPSLGFLSGGDRRRWFSETSPHDRLVSRGLWDRYPTAFEMGWHFSRWK